MAGIFLKILNMSISASWIVLVVLLLRFVFKKAPKWINCVLWGVVGLRLVMPFSLESALSLIPSSETISKLPDSPRPHIDSGVTVIDNQVNSYLQGNYFEGVTRPAGNFIDITTIISIIWVVGIIALLVYTLVSFLRLKRKIGTAVLLRDNIYQSENVISPFVLGIIKPKIYLPFNMSEDSIQNVIAHEQAHIKRKDYLWKPLGFLILTVYWFNPVMWLAYVLLCRDIELACDEKVVKDFDNEQKVDYSQALLSCSVNRRIIAACPLAFGEVGVKNRVKSVLNYKKPAFWIVIVAVVVSIIVAVCFLTNPKDNISLFGSKYETGKCYYSYVVSSDKETETNNLSFAINASGGVYKNFGDGTGEYIGELKESDFTKSDLNKLLKTQDGKRIYFGQVKVAYEILDENNTRNYVFLQLKNGDVWLVSFFTDGEIMSVFKLDLVKSTSENDTDTEQVISWTYSPMLSYTGHSFYPFEFILDYTHIIAKCDNGLMKNLDADGQPQGKTLRFEKGQHIYWTPDEAVIEKAPATSKVEFTVYNGDNEMYSATVNFQCVNRDKGSAEFEIKLEDSDCLFVITKYNTTYFSNVDFSFSDTGGVDEYINLSIENLKEKYPEFFNVSTDGGLTVYIWQMSQKSYYCHLANTAMEAVSDNSFAYKKGATIAEMRMILSTYNIKQKDITIQAVHNPLSSHYYEVDDAYQARVKELFLGTDEVIEPIYTITKLIKSIVDHSVDDGVSYDTAKELFYSDGQYDYYFPNIISQYVIVTFKDGTQKNVKEALANGDITIMDLDVFGIGYSKEPQEAEPGANPYFNAEVLEVNEKFILVKPDVNSNESKSADKISVSLDFISTIPVSTFKVGDRVRVIYNGNIAESYPAQINGVFVVYLLGENDTVLSPTPMQ